VEMPQGCTDEDLNLLSSHLAAVGAVPDFQGHPSEHGLCFVVVNGTREEIVAALEALREEQSNLITEDTTVETDGEWGIIPEVPEDAPASLLELQRRSGVPWGLDRIDDASGLDSDYSPALTGEGVHVYVMDTGILTTHSDFGGRAIPTLEVIGNGVVACSASDTNCAND